MAKKTKAAAEKTKKTAPLPAAPKAIKKAPKKAAPKKPSAKLVAGPSAPKYASLEEARSATIDALLELIENAEARLSAAKRADSIEALKALRDGK